MEWTDADAKRAKKESWRRLGGYVDRAYDVSGRSTFPNAFTVVEFLRRKSGESEWHRQVYLSLPWTYADEYMAAMEGWRLTRDSIRTRSSALFQTNEEAREHVVACAQGGDPLHIKALSTLAERRLKFGGL